MARNTYIITKDVPAGTFTYDGVLNQRIPRGTVMEINPGSPLATSLASFIVADSAQQVTPGSSDSVNPATLENVNGVACQQQGWPTVNSWGQN